MVPDAEPYALDFFHVLASNLVLGPEEDPELSLMLFPKTAGLNQAYRIISGILKYLAKDP